MKSPPIPRLRHQSGMTLLEVLVAMLVFLIGASAMVLLATNAFTANAQATRAFAATTTSRSLLAIIEGNPQIVGVLNGVALGTATGSAAPSVLQDWWSAQRQVYPDLLGARLTTQPNPCTQTAPCQITATFTVRSAFGGAQQNTFVLQDGF